MGDLLTLPARSPELDYLLWRLLELTALNDAAGWNDLIRNTEGPPSFTRNVAPTDSLPGYDYAQIGGLSILTMAGAANPALIAGLVNGYFTSSPGTNANPLNSFVENSVFPLIAQIKADQVGPATRLILAGYSLGGAIVNRMAGITNLTNTWTNVIYTTFGAPKFGGRELWPLTPNVLGERLFRANDPVPHLPVPFASGITPFLWSNRTYFVRANNYTSAPDGVQLNPDGIYTPRVFPSVSVPPSDLALRDFVSNIVAGLIPGHSIAEYTADMIAFIRQQRDTSSPPSMEGLRFTERRDNAIHPAEIRMAEKRVTTAVSAASAAQAAVPIVIAPRLRFKANRWGRVWTVNFGEQTISFGSNKRAARRLARELNASFDDILTQGVVSPDAIKQVISDFLDAAVTPNGDVIPQLRTTIPPA